MKCEFQIGQEVVCVDDLFHAEEYKKHNISLPELNVKYIIRDIYIEDYADEGPTPALLLQEIKNPVFRFVDGNDHEVGFAYWRFKPIDKNKKKTSTSTYDFNSLLKVHEEDAKAFDDELIPAGVDHNQEWQSC